MLQELFLDAIKNKDRKLSAIHGNEFEKVIQKARSRWISYTPRGQISSTNRSRQQLEQEIIPRD